MFNEKEREIFVYFNGERDVKGDPLALQRRLVVAFKEAGQSLEEVIQVLSNANIPIDSPIFGNTLDLSLPIIQTVFKVKNLEAGGLTESELLILCSEFLNYLATLKKNTEKRQNGSVSTDIPPIPKKPITRKKNTKDM